MQVAVLSWIYPSCNKTAPGRGTHGVPQTQTDQGRQSPINRGFNGILYHILTGDWKQPGLPPPPPAREKADPTEGNKQGKKGNSKRHWAALTASLSPYNNTELNISSEKDSWAFHSNNNFGSNAVRGGGGSRGGRSPILCDTLQTSCQIHLGNQIFLQEAQQDPICVLVNKSQRRSQILCYTWCFWTPSALQGFFCG